MERAKNIFKNKKVWAVIIIAILIVAIVWIVVVRKQKQKEEQVSEKVYQVKVMEAGETGSDVTLSYTGLVQPEETIQCTFETIGTIASVEVEQGQEVAEGQILCTMDAKDAQDQLESANRSLNYAEKTRKNAQESYDNAQKDYATACGTNREQDNLNDAIARRDEQQKKVNDLKTKLDGMSQYKEGSNSMGSIPETNTEYYTTKLELDSAQNTLEVYQRNVDSAQEAYDKKAKEGANSDEAKAQKERLDSSKEALDQANEAYDNAADNVEKAQSAVDKCVLRAPKAGYVVNLSATKGSVSTPIMPAVVLATHDVVINFGVSQTDVATLTAGMPAQIQIGDKSFTGSIKNVDVVPDETSRTYATNVTVDVADPDVYLGELATVKINIGERTGIWLPLSVILNDGNDYVYVVEDGRAKREYVTVLEINDDQVLVEGTKAGEKIICEGMKLVRTGSAVSYEKQD